MTLSEYLSRWRGEAPERQAVADTVAAIAGAIGDIARLAARGSLAGPLGATVANRGAGNDQKQLDILANERMIVALAGTGVVAFASEEMDEPLVIDPAGSLLVAADPIDGSTNIDANVSIGTIFSILPAHGTDGSAQAFLQPGVAQLAAGFSVYGPQTTLVLTFGSGTDVFTLDRDTGAFRLTGETVQIPFDTAEFSINASNYRHWPAAIRVYIDDCLQGREGPREKDFNMRWTASPVADLARLLAHGGIYLYPGDRREGFQSGRLRLVYEGNPLAFIIEQAGGAAWTETERILEIEPVALHQRVPVIMGSRNEVNYVVRLCAEPHATGERSPLFSRRGLFRL